MFRGQLVRWLRTPFEPRAPSRPLPVSPPPPAVADPQFKFVSPQGRPQDFATFVRAAVRGVRVIGGDGKQVGVVDASALERKAVESALDVMVVSPDADPPVVKLLNVGEYFFQQRQRRSETVKKQPAAVLKEVRVSIDIAPHDADTKLASVRKFLAKGHRVKLTVVLRGADTPQRAAQGGDFLRAVAASMADAATLESDVKVAGQFASAFLTQKKK
jgi:translation initiation factor IF-3